MGTWTRKILATVAVLSMSAGASACSSSGESDGRNAAVVAGTVCKKAGEYTKKSGQKVVCGKSAGARVWYGVASVKKTKCRSLGAIRISDGVAFVCGANKSAKVWMSTKALSAANPQVATGQIVSTGPSAQAGAAEPPTEVLNQIPSGSGSTPTAATSAAAAPTTQSSTAMNAPITLDPRESNGALVPTTTLAVADGVTVGSGARVPGPYATDLNVRQFANTYNAVCAVDTVGAVWCWGYNDSGQLGNGTVVASSVPVRNRIFDGIQHKAVKIAAGYMDDFCALDYNGSVWCWGNGSSGQMGNGMRASTATPVQVNEFDGITNKAVDLFGDWGAYCVLDATKKVWCWGASWGVAKWGNLSLRSNALSPLKIAGMESTGVLSVGIGMQSICAADYNGAVWCWGSTTGGALGIADGMVISERAPTRVLGSGREDFLVRELSASRFNYCALQRSNRVRCWGQDQRLLGSPGTLADGNPTYVRALTGDMAVKNIYGAQSHMCVISTLGKLMCWGGSVAADPEVWGHYDGTTKVARSVGRIAPASIVLNVAGALEIHTSSSLEIEGQGYTGGVS